MSASVAALLKAHRLVAPLSVLSLVFCIVGVLSTPPVQAGLPLVPVIDLHVDLPYRSFYKGAKFSRGSGQFAADDLLRGGVRGVLFPLFVPLKAKGGRSRSQFEASYAHVFRSLLATAPYSLPGCGVHRAGGEERKISTWLAFEGAAAVGADEGEIRKWALRGVRSFGLVHSQSNGLAGSSGTGPFARKDRRGLSEEGKRFIEIVAKVGGLVDVSHASDAATEDALKLSERLSRPLIATHSNARALAPHPRNLTDNHIRRIAKTGGVIGVNFYKAFLARERGSKVGIRSVVRQIRYLEKLGGIDSVAIGSDFEGGIVPVSELSNASAFPRLADALRADGMSERDIEKVFSKNALRVLCGAE